ncbi:acetyl-CoA carboxylase biotin carboxyl carrier protein [Roseomonas frigidaquae]|uniref:Biotin carboxyl carrier protein of acetyl-CoA carboxylase n=1 Tax=Falsiroseomonas frigidaquae TaxID=487318 RepID=A0ABX1F2S5_9PROT|nr:acetyl-CoA carboxylase biotin carboxyl carrier protein [Falsiroseomonas frigidaquae]NKE46591.1 acetyl-CoA carboxylase biotin carboxyl carrier protein [Falsiroseomonas frigidaquae]
MSGVHFDAAAIRELAKILRETDLTEIELVEKDSRIRVARQITVTQVAHIPAAGAPATAAPAVAAAAVAEPVSDATHPGLIASPMVGVAYLSPEPGAAAFVTVGAKVSQGQTLMLIEAMKTFNQIRAPRAGTVTRILVEGGSPVEYGEPLMIIE